MRRRSKKKLHLAAMTAVGEWLMSTDDSTAADTAAVELAQVVAMVLSADKRQVDLIHGMLERMESHELADQAEIVRVMLVCVTRLVLETLPAGSEGPAVTRPVLCEGIELTIKLQAQNLQTDWLDSFRQASPATLVVAWIVIQWLADVSRSDEYLEVERRFDALLQARVNASWQNIESDDRAQAELLEGVRACRSQRTRPTGAQHLRVISGGREA